MRFSFCISKQAPSLRSRDPRCSFFHEEAPSVCVTRFELRYCDINCSHVPPLPRAFVTFLPSKNRDHRYCQIVGSFIKNRDNRGSNYVHIFVITLLQNKSVLKSRLYQKFWNIWIFLRLNLMCDAIFEIGLNYSLR